MNISIVKTGPFVKLEVSSSVGFFHAVSEKTIYFLWFCSYIFPLFLE